VTDKILVVFELPKNVDPSLILTNVSEEGDLLDASGLCCVTLPRDKLEKLIEYLAKEECRISFLAKPLVAVSVMKTFLLQTKARQCAECGMATLLVMRAESELEARRMANVSNTHGKEITSIDWLDEESTLCSEFPVEGPKGIVVGSWFEQVTPN